MREHWNYPGRNSLAGKMLSLPLWWWVKAKSRNFDLFAWQGEGKLLDFGCGGGNYLARMRKFGWGVTGMDMSPAAVEHCRQQGMEAYVGTGVNEQFAAESFDVVTLWHVMEHVVSPSETLKQLHTILKPNGKLVLASPNFDSWLRKWFGYCWYPLDVPRHLTHFDKKTIAAMLTKNGFKVDKIFGQRHGQITQRSVKYMADQTNKKYYQRLAGVRTICSAIEGLSVLTASPSRMVVHATKV